jgi:hypothetical protein
MHTALTPFARQLARAIALSTTELGTVSDHQRRAITKQRKRQATRSQRQQSRELCREY